jgi:hypothetical protein
MNEPPTVTPVGVISPDIAIDSPEWFEWLAAQKSFHYRRTDSTNISSFTCTKRPNGRWYAVKKQRGSRENKQEYIGADQKCTRAKLDAIASLFALPNEEYWQLKEQQKQRSTGDTRAKVYNQEQLTSETGEVEALKAEVERLKQRESDLLDQLGLQKHQITCEAQELNKQLQAQVTQLDNANWKCEKQLTTYSEMYRKSEVARQELQVKVQKLEAKLTMPDLTGLKVYKLHKHDVVRIEDLVSLLEKHCGES